MASKRSLRVLFTLMDGEHRIQVNGDSEEIAQLVQISEGVLKWHRSDLASTPEKNWRNLRAAWIKSGSNNGIAAQAFSLFKVSQASHFREWPTCPYKDE